MLLLISPSGLSDLCLTRALLNAGLHALIDSRSSGCVLTNKCLSNLPLLFPARAGPSCLNIREIALSANLILSCLAVSICVLHQGKA